MKKIVNIKWKRQLSDFNGQMMWENVPNIDTSLYPEIISMTDMTKAEVVNEGDDCEWEMEIDEKLQKEEVKEYAPLPIQDIAPIKLTVVNEEAETVNIALSEKEEVEKALCIDPMTDQEFIELKQKLSTTTKLVADEKMEVV